MAKHTIKLKKYSDNIVELAAAAAITPGMLLELTSAGTVQAHSTAGGNAAPIYIALEDELQGNGIDTAYVAADRVQTWIPYRGDEAYMILKDDTTAVVIGDLLESSGDGYLQKHVADVESFESAEAGAITVYPNQIIAQALEALDLSDSSGAESSGALGYNKRIKVRIV